jgi:hypothetical protein
LLAIKITLFQSWVRKVANLKILLYAMNQIQLHPDRVLSCKLINLENAKTRKSKAIMVVKTRKSKAIVDGTIQFTI